MKKMLRGVVYWVKKAVAAIEDNRTPLVYYFISFIGWLAVRQFIELFSDNSRLRFELLSCADYKYYPRFLAQILSFSHHGLCWLQNFLAGAIILALGTGEKIGKVLRVVLSSVCAIILTPLVDLAVSGGRGLNLHYPNPKSFGDFFPIPRDLTVGMSATAAAIISITLIYALVKTKNIFKTAAIMAALYAGGMFSLLLPFFLRPAKPLMATRVFAALLAVEIIILARLWSKDFFSALWRDIRATRVTHYLLMFLLGIALVPDGLESISREWLSFVLMIITVIFSWKGAVILNDVSDVEIDRVSNPSRPLAAGVVDPTAYSLSGWVCLGIAVLCAFFVSMGLAFLTVTGIGISIIYSLPPFRLKRIPLFSKTIIAAASLLLVITGYVFAGRPLLGFPRIIIWYFIIFVGLALNFIDLKDTAGDKAGGIKTLPVIFGEGKAKIITGVFFIAAYLAAGLLLKRILLLPVAGAAGLLQFFFINDRKRYRENRVLVTYLISLILILAVLFWW